MTGRSVDLTSGDNLPRGSHNLQRRNLGKNLISTVCSAEEKCSPRVCTPLRLGPPLVLSVGRRDACSGSSKAGGMPTSAASTGSSFNRALLGFFALGPHEGVAGSAVAACASPEAEASPAAARLALSMIQSNSSCKKKPDYAVHDTHHGAASLSFLNGGAGVDRAGLYSSAHACLSLWMVRAWAHHLCYP